MTLCLFHGTNKTYTDCCTDSSIKVCNYLMVMFFCCFILYAGIFIYIMNKKQWMKEQGLYVQIFTFQMCVLLLRGLYYSHYGRVENQSLNMYMALRTAPIICSL